MATLQHASDNPEYVKGLVMVTLNSTSHKTYSLSQNIAFLVDYFMIYSIFSLISLKITNLATLLHGSGNPEYVTGSEMGPLNFSSLKTYSLSANIAF